MSECAREMQRTKQNKTNETNNTKMHNNQQWTHVEETLLWVTETNLIHWFKSK